MAFGRDDTDEWYDTNLQPLLLSLGVKCRRVDRITHNDDIDDRIMHELATADIVVADLTYARPSVYFEAGLAQRAVPVIYTARADHLERSAPDTGRIHFDLSMKNIHAWTQPNDQKFAKKFSKAFKLVSAPILAAERATNETKLAELAFSGMSQRDRLDAMSKSLRLAVIETKIVTLPRERQASRSGAASLTSGGRVMGVQYVALESLTRAHLQELIGWEEIRFPQFNVLPPPGEPVVTKAADITLIATLGTVPITRLTSVLPNFQVVGAKERHLRGASSEIWSIESPGDYRKVVPGGGPHSFWAEMEDGKRSALDVLPPNMSRGLTNHPTPQLVGAMVPREIEIVVIDNVKSILELTTRAQAALERWLLHLN
jgi:nucleoside 2-deoxyribosyltransferase